MGEVADSILNQWNQLQSIKLNTMPQWIKVGIYHININTGLVIYAKPKITGMFMLSTTDNFILTDNDSADMQKMLSQRVDSGAIVEI
jgi:hypothetical protein